MTRLVHVGLAVALVLSAGAAGAQSSPFVSSDLPIVLIDTGGATIPDEPKIPGTMAIIDNGPGQRNAVTDEPNDYRGRIGIEVRGSSSQFFYPKKQWGFETRDENGDNDNVSLLGMPSENDWILYAPYGDKSLMRNVLAYHLARATGHYASRTRYCEVVLNGQYQGLYVLEEKIKRDGDRVDINRLRPDEIEGDDLTGGYILQIDRTDDGPQSFWTSPFPPAYNPGLRVSYVFDDPDGDDLVPVQKAYIRDVVTRFEAAMASPTYDTPETGYPAFIDTRSFVDFILVNELGRNVDGYRLSTFLHKDKDSNNPLLVAGPVWDFNLAFGNADYHNGASTQGLQVDFAIVSDDKPVAFWWPKLYRAPSFRDSLRTRWAELRQGPFHSDTLAAFIDSNAEALAESQTRNFERWPILGRYVWPNAFVGATYTEEVDYLRTWLADRLQWLDVEFRIPVAGEIDPTGATEARLSAPVPNPSRGTSRVALSVRQPQHVRVTLIDALGRRVADVFDGHVVSGTENRLDIPVGTLSPGVYVIRAVGETFAEVQRLTVLQ